MTEAEQLAEVIGKALEDDAGIYDTSWYEDCAMANRILAAGYRKPRVITEEADLAALPNSAVIRDSEGDVAEKRGGDWCGYEAFLTDHQQAKFLPATVLDEGDSK